jgi:predicted phosphodiesterase
VSTALVFSDLHANKQALNDIVPVVDRIDLSIFCGDILGYGRDIDACIDFILDNVDLAVLGNHDRMAVSEESLENQLPVVKQSVLYTRAHLSKQQRERISSLPREIWHDDLYITHSIDDKYLREPKDFQQLLKRRGANTKYFLFGHTHERVLFRHGNDVVLNPGSITKGRRNFSRGYALIEDGDIRFVDLEAIL